MENKLNNRDAFIELIRLALNKEKADDDIISVFKDDELFRIARFQRITALLSTVFKSPDEKWQREKAETIKRTVLYDTERENLFRF